jgi:hypothetical protein
MKPKLAGDHAIEEMLEALFKILDPLLLKARHLALYPGATPTQNGKWYADGGGSSQP